MVYKIEASPESNYEGIATVSIDRMRHYLKDVDHPSPWIEDPRGVEMPGDEFAHTIPGSNKFPNSTTNGSTLVSDSQLHEPDGEITTFSTGPETPAPLDLLGASGSSPPPNLPALSNQGWIVDSQPQSLVLTSHLQGAKMGPGTRGSRMA